MTPDEVRIFEQAERKAEHEQFVARAHAALAAKRVKQRAETLHWLGRYDAEPMIAVKQSNRQTPPHTIVPRSRPTVIAGDVKTSSQWARELGISPNTFYQRVHRLGSLEAVLARAGVTVPGVGSNLDAHAGDRRGEVSAISNENRVFSDDEELTPCL